MRNTIVLMRTAVAILGLMCAVTFVAVAQQPGQAPPTARTAEQAYKNITVLKTIPNTQLIPTMRFMATALGVECEFCHEGDRAKDTEHKNMARKMMTMMMGINSASFNGRASVTCYTCHHGSSTPAGAPTPTGQYSELGANIFYKPDGGPVGSRDVVMWEAYKEYMDKNPLAGMPTVDQIFAKYVTALGGEAAIRKVTSRTITGGVEMAAEARGGMPNLNGPVQIYSKAPGEWSINIQTAAGKTANGFDGNVAWIQSANGVVTEATAPNNNPLPPLARVKRDSDFYAPLNLKQAYARTTMRGIEKVGNRDAYLVIGFPQGDNPEELYFDRETGLLLRKVTSVPTALGNYATQTDYDDYRPSGGVKVPFLTKTISISPADYMVIHVEKVEVNKEIEAAKLAKPASRPPAAR